MIALCVRAGVQVECLWSVKECHVAKRLHTHTHTRSRTHNTKQCVSSVHTCTRERERESKGVRGGERPAVTNVGNIDTGVLLMCC
jgi:hypothetical protein